MVRHLELSTIAMLVLAGANVVLAMVALGILVSKRLHPEPRSSASAQRRYNFSVAFYVLITLMGLLRAACLVVEELWSDYFFNEAAHWQLLVLALPTFMYLSVEFLMLCYWYECLHVSLRRNSVLDTFLSWLSEGSRPVSVILLMTVMGYLSIMPTFLYCVLLQCNAYLPIITYLYVNAIYFLLAAAFVVMSYRLVVLSGSKEFSLIGTLAHFVMWVTAIGLFCRGVVGMLELSPDYRAWADPIEWIQVGYYGVLEFLQVVAVLLGLHAIKSTLRQLHFTRLNDDHSDSGI